MEKINSFPPHWKIDILGEVCDKISLNGIKVKQKDYLIEGKYPVIDQGQDLIGGYYNDERLVIQSEPPYIIFGDHTKVKKFINFKFIAGADGVKVLKPHSLFDPKFFFYLIHTIEIPDKGYARHFQFLEKEEIPIPPLPEQLAIVSKIEELLSDLENGKQQLQTAQQQLKIYRQSLLKWAFEGKLTAPSLPPPPGGWVGRQQAGKGELPEGWRMVTTEDVTSKITDGEHLTPSRISQGEMLLSAKNIRDGFIDYSKHDWISKEDFEKCLMRCNPEVGDILIVSVGATIGRASIVRENIKFALVRSVALLKPSAINSKYLLFFIQSPQTQKRIQELSQGSAQNCLYINKIKQIEIPLPSAKEQIFIAEELESKLTVCDKIEETINQSLEQADTLRQSILKRAFKGRLV